MKKCKGSGAHWQVFTAPLPDTAPPQDGEPYKYYTMCGSLLQAAYKKIERTSQCMGKILETFFEGNLLVEPITEKRTEEHKAACDHAYNLVEELESKLNTDEKELLEQVVEALNVENQYYAAERFVRGYSLGALMMLEVFEKRDEFLLLRE